MKTLFSCLYGSMLYGTSTSESDRDMKCIVLPDLDSLLLGISPKNKVKTPSKSLGEKNKAGDIDIEEIPLHVFAKDFMEGQTYALELAYAVDCVDAEQAIFDGRFPKFVEELRNNFLTSNVNAMCGYAVNQAKIYSNKGDRLNAANEAKHLFSSFPLLDKISDHSETFNEVAKDIEETYPEYFQVSEYAIDATNTVMRPCIKLLEKTLPYSNTFETNLTVVNKQIEKFGSRAKAASMTTADFKAVSHAIRIVNEGIDLLSGKKLSYPYSKEYCDYLLSVKRGELNIDTISELISNKVDELKTLSLNSKLPKYDAELKEKFNIWLLGWLKKIYNLEGIV